MTKDEALMYLKAIVEAFGPDDGIELDQKTWANLHTAIKEALAQPGRTWVGLTDEERKNIMIECESTGDWAWELKAAQAIEAKLKERNT